MISQHWFRLWLGAVRQQAITWANVDPVLCHRMASLGHHELTHQGRVMHICVSEVSQSSLVPIMASILSAPIHYWNQYWVIVNWTAKNKLHRNFNKNTIFVIQKKNAFENVVSRMAAILSQASMCSASYIHNSQLGAVSPSTLPVQESELALLNSLHLHLPTILFLQEFDFCKDVISSFCVLEICNNILDRANKSLLTLC